MRVSDTITVCKMKNLIIIIFAFILALSSLPTFALASEGSLFQFTTYPGECFTMTFSGGELVLAALPVTDQFQTVVVRIISEDEEVKLEKLMNRQSDGTVTLPLPDLRDGYYFLELYLSSGGNDFYSYAYGNDICFHWRKGAGTFIESLTLAKNKSTFLAGRVDAAALTYYLTPTDIIQSDDENIVKLARTITQNIVGDYEKVLQIHDWICKNLRYDVNAAQTKTRIPSDSISTMNNKRAVCEGYSNLTAALLRSVNIPAKVVFGYGRSTSSSSSWTQIEISEAYANHAWNEAYVNGRWIIIDTTWDSITEGRKDNSKTNGGVYFYRYFDATLESFSVDHRIDKYIEDKIPQPGAAT